MVVLELEADNEAERLIAAADARRQDYADGRHGWPSIFVYRWHDAAGLREDACPPRLHVPADRDTEIGYRQKRASSEPKTWPALTVVAPGMLAHYDALRAAGRLRDPGHLGAESGLAEDLRPAPEA